MSDGVEFRPLVVAADYAGMAAVRTGSVEWDEIDPRSAREALPIAARLARILPLDQLVEHKAECVARALDRLIGSGMLRYKV